ncbi:MAG: hypothetical protein HZA78_00480 [Candidatus Schekmanbacteria bacterium]|nr:hypothetical protein [Candidatus Schekmanbacteria bacterium]
MGNIKILPDNSEYRKPGYDKPRIVASYTQKELHEEFRGLRGLTFFVDLKKP